MMDHPARRAALRDGHLEPRYAPHERRGEPVGKPDPPRSARVVAYFPADYSEVRPLGASHPDLVHVRSQPWT
jgi:hypothetical protein